MSFLELVQDIALHSFQSLFLYHVISQSMLKAKFVDIQQRLALV